MLPYMSCIMFLVIANKNLFLFSKCGASVHFFARPSVPLVAARWRQRTLGKLVQVHGRERVQPKKRSGKFSHTKSGRTDSSGGVIRWLTENPTTVIMAVLIDSLSSMFNTLVILHINSKEF